VIGSAGQIPVASTGALLVRGSVLNVLTLIASVAVGFFLMPFLIHTLGDRWYGMWALVGSITSYYALLDLGLTSAVNRFLMRAVAREEKTDASAVIVTALAIFGGIGASVLLVSIGVALGAGWFLHDPAEIAVFRQVVVILGADVALAFPFAVFNGLLIAHCRFDILSGVQLLALAARTALIVYFISRGYSLLALAVITLSVNLPSRLALAAAARRLFPSLQLSAAHLRWEQARQLFGYGKYAFIAVSADRVRFHVDTVVVASFLGVGLVTHYAIAARLAQLFMELMIRALGVLGPVFMRVEALGDRDQMRRALLLATRVSVLASVTVAGGIIILGERFIELWVGEAYADAYWPLVILTSSLAVALMQAPSVSYLYASARHWYYAYVTAAEAVANLVLSMILVQSYGMVGVSLGTAIPLLVTNLLFQPWYVCRSLDLELRTYFRELLRSALIAAVGQVPLFLFLQRLAEPSPAVMLLIAVCYYPLCLALLFGGNFAERDRKRIANAVALRWPQPRSVASG
jgi:O-antigen/teichoic acid export membrane protein